MLQEHEQPALEHASLLEPGVPFDSPLEGDLLRNFASTMPGTVGMRLILLVITIFFGFVQADQLAAALAAHPWHIPEHDKLCQRRASRGSSMAYGRGAWAIGSRSKPDSGMTSGNSMSLRDLYTGTGAQARPAVSGSASGDSSCLSNVQDRAEGISSSICTDEQCWQTPVWCIRLPQATHWM